MDNLIVETENDELMHYGVKGMKWGVRRKRYLSKARSKVRKLKRERSKKKQERKAERAVRKATKKISEQPKHKPISEMTDEELKVVIDRMDLERKYKEAIAKNNPQSDRGKKFVTNVLERSGEQLVTQVLNHYGAKALNKMINEKDSETGELKEIIFANNRKK